MWFGLSLEDAIFNVNFRPFTPIICPCTAFITGICWGVTYLDPMHKESLKVTLSPCSSLGVDRPVGKIVNSNLFLNAILLCHDWETYNAWSVKLCIICLATPATLMIAQMELLNKDSFTLIGFIPRGYGKTRPPRRDWPPDYLTRDADDAAALMKVMLLALIPGYFLLYTSQYILLYYYILIHCILLYACVVNMKPFLFLTNTRKLFSFQFVIPLPFLQIIPVVLPLIQTFYWTATSILFTYPFY